MKVSVVIVGIGQWTEFTKPLIDSIRKYEPDVDIMVVDNGDDYPNEYFDVRFERTKHVVSYASALNIGLRATKEFDWVIFINNDAIAIGKFVDYLKGLDRKAIYGNKIHIDFREFHHKDYSPFIDGWIIIVTRENIDAIGEFDTEFKIAGFEDADFAFRSNNAGYPVTLSTIAFKHLGYHIRKQFENYPEYRKQNFNYLLDKHGLEAKKERKGAKPLGR